MAATAATASGVVARVAARNESGSHCCEDHSGRIAATRGQRQRCRRAAAMRPGRPGPSDGDRRGHGDDQHVPGGQPLDQRCVRVVDANGRTHTTTTAAASTVADTATPALRAATTGPAPTTMVTLPIVRL